MAILPGNVSNVTVIDGDVYCLSSGVMLKALRNGEQFLGFWADTAFVKLGENIEFVVRHPVTGDVYFTQRDKKGRSFLYVCQNFGEEKMKVKQLRLGGGLFNKGMTVEHPTFSLDGNILIFSSDQGRHNLGGYDLWYTQYTDGKWDKPHNLGDRVNTRGDEMTPSIYRECLLFSSNGHKEDYGHLSLYSTRLISDRVIGDTVGMLQIGRCRVQRLPEPLNTTLADDFDMIIDTVNDCGYWVSTRVASETDSQLYSFSGALDGVLLWGLVTDKQENALSGVRVTARQGDEVVCVAYTDADGYYRLYLRSDQFYDLGYQLDGYYIGYESVNTTKGEEEYLISEMRADMQLDRFPVGQRIHFSDLFGPDVDVELSERGIELLEPLVRYLNDNPSLSVKMKLVNDLTNNTNFNRMLTEQRIQSLENHLYPLLPPTVKIAIENGCAGREGCSGASGKSRLTVLITNDLQKK
jgi:hypothetical protein